MPSGLRLSSGSISRAGMTSIARPTGSAPRLSAARIILRGSCPRLEGSAAPRHSRAPEAQEDAVAIELWTWNTPNGRKISAALEEMELPYTVRPVDITKGGQFDPAFLRISPNNKIPAII